MHNGSAGIAMRGAARVTSGLRRHCGTANCWPSTCAVAIRWSGACANVSACLGRWSCDCENPGRLSPKPIRPHKWPLKKLHRLAAHSKVELWSIHECRFQQHGTRCRMWVPLEEKDPVLLHAPTRKSVACFGAVNVHTGRLVTAFEPKFNADSFERFLKKLLKHRSRNKRMVVIVDNARYHHACALRIFLRRHRKTLTLLFLPPYSPELNPIERVWRLTRRLATHNRYFSHLHDLENAVSRQMALWQKPNRVLHKLCCII